MSNFFGDPYMMWHDGIDPTSVCLLEGAERDQAEAMLIESLEDGSHYAAMGLREIRSEKALPIMKRLLPRVSADLKTEIAVALNVIENSTEYNSYIIEILLEYPSPYVRLNAALRLRDFATPEVIEALFNAVCDVDYLVRNHASESLLHIHRLNPTISEYREIFNLLITEFNHDDESSFRLAKKNYAQAADMLRRLFQ